MDDRYDFIVSTFDKDASSKDIRGAYGEVMGGILLHAMIQQATNGEYTVIPTPPQLDMKRRHIGQSTLEKTADVLLGQVIQKGEKRVIKPIMLFDIKSYRRNDRAFSNIGSGINIGLTPLPVGIIYLGELEFQSQDGNRKPAWSYLEENVHPAALNNMLRLRALWPERTRINPQHQLFQTMAQESLASCRYTKEKIRQQSLRHHMENVLLSNIDHAENIFRQVQSAFMPDISAA